MKASDHNDLKRLIERMEHQSHVSHTGTVTMAALGLVAFGVMLVPVWGGAHLNLALAPQAPAAPVATLPDPYASVNLIGQAAVVYDLTTGKTLYEKNADKQLPLASLTKLITIYAAAGALDAHSTVTITPQSVAQVNDPGDIGLAAGERFAFEDIARYALVTSSNNAAEAITEAAANAKATTNTDLLASAISAAGLTQTRANNPTGLDVSDTVSGGYGSAIDVAKIAAALLAKAPDIARATVEPSISVRAETGQTLSQPNTNQDIVTLPSPLLSKTGYTDLAGGNLVVVFDAGINHPIAAVVLGSTKDGRFTDVNQLVAKTLDYFGQRP